MDALPRQLSDWLRVLTFFWPLMFLSFPLFLSSEPTDNFGRTPAYFATLVFFDKNLSDNNQVATSFY
jgi:hypothetical protein